MILKKKKKIGKNPAVNTSFLPDKDREAQELQEIGFYWDITTIYFFLNLGSYRLDYFSIYPRYLYSSDWSLQKYDDSSLEYSIEKVG